MLLVGNSSVHDFNQENRAFYQRRAFPLTLRPRRGFARERPMSMESQGALAARVVRLKAYPLEREWTPGFVSAAASMVTEIARRRRPAGEVMGGLHHCCVCAVNTSFAAS